MLAPYTALLSATAATAKVRRTSAGDEPHVLNGAFASLGIENDHHWAWSNYKAVLRNLCSRLAAHRLIEIGGGRNPLFDPNEIKNLGVEMTVNDIAPCELARLPQDYQTACFDVAGDISAVEHLRGTFDFAFSRMVFEHVADGKRAWANLYELLAPGGTALTFIPTLYSVPFLLNWLLPDKLATAIVTQLCPNRGDRGEPVFPARYSWCVANEARLRPMLSRIGYREIVVQPFYGHQYYRYVPIVRDLHEWFTGTARRRDLRMFASYAYIAARK